MTAVRHRLILAASVAAGLLVNVRPAGACTCVPPPPANEALAMSAAVFEGRVISITPSASSAIFGPLLRVEIEVLRVWKGKVGRTAIVQTSNSGAACGFFFAAGVSYLVYALDQEQGLQTTLCSRTQPSDQAAADLAALGPGQPPATDVDAGAPPPAPPPDAGAPDTAADPSLPGQPPPQSVDAARGSATVSSEGTGCAAAGSGPAGRSGGYHLMVVLAGWLAIRRRTWRTGRR